MLGLSVFVSGIILRLAGCTGDLILSIVVAGAVAEGGAGGHALQCVLDADNGPHITLVVV